MSTSSASFRMTQSKLNELFWWQSQTEAFQQSNSASFQTHPKFHLCPPYLQVSGRSDENWMSYTDEKVRDFFSNQGQRNSMMKDPIWLGFKLIWNFIHVHLISKFQENQITTEWVSRDITLKSNRGFFQQSRGSSWNLQIRWTWMKSQTSSTTAQISSLV